MAHLVFFCAFGTSPLPAPDAVAAAFLFPTIARSQASLSIDVMDEECVEQHGFRPRMSLININVRGTGELFRVVPELEGGGRAIGAQTSYRDGRSVE